MVVRMIRSFAADPFVHRPLWLTTIGFTRSTTGIDSNGYKESAECFGAGSGDGSLRVYPVSNELRAMAGKVSPGAPCVPEASISPSESSNRSEGKAEQS